MIRHIKVSQLIRTVVVVGSIWYYVKIFRPKRHARKQQEAIQLQGSKGVDYLSELPSPAMTRPPPTYSRSNRTERPASSAPSRGPVKTSRNQPSARDDLLRLARASERKVKEKYKDRTETNRRAREIFSEGMAHQKAVRKRRKEDSLSS